MADDDCECDHDAQDDDHIYTCQYCLERAERKAWVRGAAWVLNARPATPKKRTAVRRQIARIVNGQDMLPS